MLIVLLAGGLEELLGKISSFLWGWPLILLLLVAGLYFTLLTRFVQLRKFFYGWKVFLGHYDRELSEREGAGGVLSHFKALSTALSATIGTGNIVGVATAIILGGIGAPVWMLVSGFLGMATKFVTCTLSNRYREVDEEGNVYGGPMYVIVKALPKSWHWLAWLFAISLSIAAFGIGNLVQANAVSQRFTSLLIDRFQLVAEPGFLQAVIGFLLAALVFLVIIGGIRSIGTAAGILVPVMALGYLAGGLVILLFNLDKLGAALGSMFAASVSLKAGFGGLMGTAVRYGFARGLFSNEAGLGSAPIAHAAARTREPVREGYVAMIGPFIDTIVICMMTATVIIVTMGDKLSSYGEGRAADLTAHAFELGLGAVFPPSAGAVFVSLALAIFAFTTILGWSYYGEQGIAFLLGKGAILPYRLVWVAVVFVGSVSQLSLVWTLSDIFNALMAIPNLLAAFALAHLVARWERDYSRGKRMNITEEQLRRESVRLRPQPEGS